MHKIGLLLVCASCLTLAIGCGDDSEEEGEVGELPEVDCSGDVPKYAEVTAFEVCANCHSSTKSGADRNSAPPEDNFDTYASAEKGATEAVEEVFGGDMPPAGTFTLTEDQKQQLYLWALCGAQE